MHYLLAAAGLKNRTPATFIAANENGNDPTPADMAAVLDMIAGREVAALLVNPQKPTAATDELQVRPAGRSANHRVDRDLAQRNRPGPVLRC